MFFKFFEALIEHENCSINIFFIVVGVLCNLIENVCLSHSLFLSSSSFTSDLLYDNFLELSGSFDIFSCFLVHAEVIRALLFYVKLKELKIRLHILLEAVCWSIFFSKHFTCEQLLSTVVSS